MLKLISNLCMCVKEFLINLPNLEIFKELFKKSNSASNVL